MIRSALNIFQAKRNGLKKDRLAEMMGGFDPLDHIYHILNERLPAGGFSLEKDLKGEILEITFAPNESKVISHGLRTTPKFRLILRQTGNAIITDIDAKWTDRTVGFLNNGATTVKAVIQIFP